MGVFAFVVCLVVVLAHAAQHDSAGPAPAKFSVAWSMSFHSPNGPHNPVIVIEVDRSWAPIGVDRFWTLQQVGYYALNGIFRVVPGFVSQFGISGIPSVAAKWENANIQDDPVTRSNIRGTIAFASAGPNTRTTQLFVNLANNSFLDSQGFAPIARVAVGMEYIDAIYTGYGQSPDQGRLYAEGNAYLMSNFPMLTYFNTTTVVHK